MPFNAPLKRPQICSKMFDKDFFECLWWKFWEAPPIMTSYVNAQLGSSRLGEAPPTQNVTLAQRVVFKTIPSIS